MRCSRLAICNTCCTQRTTWTSRLKLELFLHGFNLLFAILQVCQPIMTNGTTCTDEINAGKYITNFECRGVGSSRRMLKEMRLSFPSGHSSFTFYTMVYVAVSCVSINWTSSIDYSSFFTSLQLYLQGRMTWHGSKLLRHFLQFLFIMIAWYTALSRVSDYKHHWSDVLAGSAIGASCALIVVSRNFLSKGCPAGFILHTPFDHHSFRVTFCQKCGSTWNQLGPAREPRRSDFPLRDTEK